MPFLSAFASSSRARGSFSRCRLRGTHEARPYTYAARLGLGQFRGTCSGSPKSRELAQFQGIGFRLAEPRRTVETPGNLHNFL